MTAPASSTKALRHAGDGVRRGLSPSVYVWAVLAIALLLWMAWVTRAVLTSGEAQPRFVAVRLQTLVEEYVQAQARAATPEAQATRETGAFMAVLDAELRRRGRDGATVLVAEAVLSKNVPDVTAEIRRAVYARVPVPGAAVVQEPGRARN